jgi:hypothetical protein
VAAPLALSCEPGSAKRDQISQGRIVARSIPRRAFRAMACIRARHGRKKKKKKKILRRIQSSESPPEICYQPQRNHQTVFPLSILGHCSVVPEAYLRQRFAAKAPSI